MVVVGVSDGTRFDGPLSARGTIVGGNWTNNLARGPRLLAAGRSARYK